MLESQSVRDVYVLNLGFSDGFFIKEKGEKALLAALDAVEEGGMIMLRSGVTFRVTSTLKPAYSVHICSVRFILVRENGVEARQSGQPHMIVLGQSVEARSLLRICSAGMRVALTDIAVECAAEPRARKGTKTREPVGAFEEDDEDLLGTPHLLSTVLAISEVNVLFSGSTSLRLNFHLQTFPVHHILGLIHVVGKGVCLKLVDCNVLGSGSDDGPHFGLIVKDDIMDRCGYSHLNLLILVGCHVSHHRGCGVDAREASVLVEDCCFHRNGHSGASLFSAVGECCGSTFNFNGHYG